MTRQGGVAISGSQHRASACRAVCPLVSVRPVRLALREPEGAAADLEAAADSDADAATPRIAVTEAGIGEIAG